MNHQLTATEALLSVQRSIASAESVYERRNTVSATERQVAGINIAIERIIPGIARLDRVNTLRILFRRDEGYFNSSNDMTLAGASALRDRLYGPDAVVDKDTPILPVAAAAVREAYQQATGQLDFGF